MHSYGSFALTWTPGNQQRQSQEYPFLRKRHRKYAYVIVALLAVSLVYLVLGALQPAEEILRSSQNSLYEDARQIDPRTQQRNTNDSSTFALGNFKGDYELNINTSVGMSPESSMYATRAHPPTWIPRHDGTPPPSFSPDCAKGGDDCCRWHWPGDPVVRQSSYHDLTCAHSGQAQTLRGSGRDCIAGFACRYCCAPPVSESCANWRRSLDLTRAAAVCKNWPTNSPTKAPTPAPTAEPTQYPTQHPTVPPTPLPTVLPTPEPTYKEERCYTISHQRCPSAHYLREIEGYVGSCEQCAQKCGYDSKCSYYTLVPANITDSKAKLYTCELYASCHRPNRNGTHSSEGSGGTGSGNRGTSNMGGLGSVTSFSMEPGGGEIGDGEGMGGINVGYGVEEGYPFWATVAVGTPLCVLVFLGVTKAVTQANASLFSWRSLGAVVTGVVVASSIVAGLRIPYLVLLALSVTLFLVAVVHVTRRGTTRDGVFPSGSSILKSQISWLRICLVLDIIVLVFSLIWLILLLVGVIHPIARGVIGGGVFAVITILLVGLFLASFLWGFYPHCKASTWLSELGWEESTAPPALAAKAMGSKELGDKTKGLGDGKTSGKGASAAMGAYEASKGDATELAWTESLLPVILGVEVCMSLIVDSVMRWPEVHVFERAVCDAIMAMCIAALTIGYLIWRLRTTAEVVEGFEWAKVAGDHADKDHESEAKAGSHEEKKTT